MDKKERYLQWGYCEYKDTETDMVKGNYVQVMNEQVDKIADLEAKLAESEKTEDGAFWFEKWQHKKRDYDSVYKAYIENCAEVDQLKQQLAEKGERTAIRTIEILKSVSSKTYESASDGSEHIIAWLFTPMDVKETLEFINREKFEFKTENQTAIAVLEEMLENEIYLNVIPDFECGDYVSSKIIKTKIEELKNGRN